MLMLNFLACKASLTTSILQDAPFLTCLLIINFFEQSKQPFPPLPTLTFNIQVNQKRTGCFKTGHFRVKKKPVSQFNLLINSDSSLWHTY
jgi:hypothetical protein